MALVKEMVGLVREGEGECVCLGGGVEIVAQCWKTKILWAYDLCHRLS